MKPGACDSELLLPVDVAKLDVAALDVESDTLGDIGNLSSGFENRKKWSYDDVAVVPEEVDELSLELLHVESDLSPIKASFSFSAHNMREGKRLTRSEKSR